MPSNDKPIEDFCCGSYCSEAGCCPFEKQKELFPDAPEKRFKPTREYPPLRGDTRPFDTRKPYEKITVPDWVKEQRNRDTDSNL